MESVVPATESVVADEVEEAHFCVGDFDSLVVGVWDQLGGNDEARLRGGGTDEIESLGDIGERLAGPVSADLAEQTMFDGIPLGSAGRVVADGDSEPQGNADGVLKRFFPGAGTRAVAASAIRQDEQFSGRRITLAAFLQPPLRNGLDSKGWGVVTGPEKHRAPVGQRIVDAVGSYQRLGLGTKVVIFDRKGIAIPFGAGVFEVADQFLFLGIDTDDGQSLSGKSFLLLADVKELLMAVRVLGGGDLFAVCLLYTSPSPRDS